jgi:hypothetical protein
MRAFAMGAAATALLIAVTACTAATPTLIVVHTTATPAPTAPPTPVATPTPTPTPTPAPTDTPIPGSSVPASAAPSSAPSATLTAAPVASGGPASACSGASKPDNAAFWASTANHEPFTVYCGVVPGPYPFVSANSTFGSTGLLTATYQTTGGGRIDVSEGTFTAAAHTGSLGSAKFGDLSGSLYSMGSGFVIYVAGTHAYQAIGTGVTQATFVSIVAAMAKVAKS